MSTVKRILPPAPGVFVAIMGFDDQVWLENTGPPLIVLGYRREPYRVGDTDHVILGSLDYTPTRDSNLVAKIAVGAAIALTVVAACSC